MGSNIVWPLWQDDAKWPRPTNSSMASDPGKGPEIQEDPITGISERHRTAMVFLKSLWNKTIKVVLEGARLEGERLEEEFSIIQAKICTCMFSLKNEGKHFCCVICFPVLFKGLK